VSAHDGGCWQDRRSCAGLIAENYDRLNARQKLRRFGSRETETPEPFVEVPKLSGRPQSHVHDIDEPPQDTVGACPARSLAHAKLEKIPRQAHSPADNVLIQSRP